MAHKLTFFPIGNAETSLLELDNGKCLLFDFADVYEGAEDDERYDIKKDLSEIQEFQVVMFSHAHEDHTKGASKFFYLDYAKEYQSDSRAKIEELWISAAFLLDTNLENGSDAKIIRQEARHRFKSGYGVRIFGEPEELKNGLIKKK